jgi:hypothetical protein
MLCIGISFSPIVHSAEASPSQNPPFLFAARRGPATLPPLPYLRPILACDISMLKNRLRFPR